MAYQFLAYAFRNSEHVVFHLTDNFYQITEVEGWKFLITHGDQIKMHLNLPWYSLTTKAMRWLGSIGDFNFMVVGHFHVFSHIHWNNIEILTNGTFVTDDEWVKKVLGLSGSCCQILTSVHPRRGLAFVRAIQLDR